MNTSSPLRSEDAHNGIGGFMFLMILPNVAEEEALLTRLQQRDRAVVVDIYEHFFTPQIGRRSQWDRGIHVSDDFAQRGRGGSPADSPSAARPRRCRGHL